MDEVRFGSRSLAPWRELRADGHPIPLGRPPLAILSVLAQADGEIVSKDDLLSAVWPNVVVEENALQVHVSALRKALGAEAGRLKTIRGVGYRFDLEAGSGKLAFREGRASTGTWMLRWFTVPRALGAAVALLGLAALGAYLWQSPTAPPPIEFVRLAPIVAGKGKGAGELAREIEGDVIDVLSQAGIQAVLAEEGLASAERGYLVRGSVIQGERGLTAQLILADAQSGATLWSKQFPGNAATTHQLAMEAAVGIARSIFTVRELLLQEDLDFDPASIALHIRASELVRGAEVAREGTPRELTEQFVERIPQSAHGHGLLAMAWINEARRAAPEARPELLREARSEANKAISISPSGAGTGYDALYLMQRTSAPRQWIAAETFLDEAARGAPRFAFLIMRRCRLLVDVGRPRAALPYCQRALALHPFAEPIGHSYARALNAAGEARLAREVIDQFARFNPRHGITSRVRFELAAFGDQPEEAIALLDDVATTPPDLEGDGERAMRSYLSVRANRIGASGEVAGQILTTARRGELPLDWAVMALAGLGDLAHAFELLDSPQVDELLFSSGSGFLFQPASAPLRADPRFWRAAAALGLGAYWQTRGKWPDVCGRELALANCRAMTSAS